MNSKHVWHKTFTFASSLLFSAVVACTKSRKCNSETLAAQKFLVRAHVHDTCNDEFFSVLDMSTAAASTTDVG